MQSHKIVVDNIMTNYVTYGEGDMVILMLHGWADSSQTFVRLIQNLPKNKYIALDLPGFGETERPGKAWGLNEYADFVGKFIEKINLRPDVVIGHSNGGAISIRAIANQKILPNKLILLASSGIRGEYKGRNKVARLIAKTGKIATKPLPNKMQNKLKRKLYSTIGSDLLVAENMQDTFKRIIEDDVRTDAKNIKTPTLLVYGENDKDTPLSFAIILNENISNSRLEVIENAGHFVFRDQIEKVTVLIKEFI